MPSYNIVMLWDCASCDTKGLKGTDDHCPGCGAAHDHVKSPWYMPGDTSHANRITDAEDLRKAKAGPNWMCPRCDGTQRNGDGDCLNCSAPRNEPTNPDVTGFEEDSAPVPDERSWRPSPPPYNGNGPFLKMVALIVAAVLLCAGSAWALFHQRQVDITVVSVSWTQTVSVERNQQVSQDGFRENKPSDAENVEEVGSKVHHYDRVLDHYETIHYTEEVSDGESCAAVPETCYTTPVSCTPNDNGTASCSGGDEVCSGGGESCTPKYRTENRTREEAVYRDDPVYAMSYRWTVWRWSPNRTVPHSGTTTETTWASSEEICLGCRVDTGEKERESGRAGTYRVTFVDAEKETYDFVPKSEPEFRNFPIGSKRQALYSIAGGLDFQSAITVN